MSTSKATIDMQLKDERDSLRFALKALRGLFEGDVETSFIVAPATNRPMTNGEQERIDSAFLLADLAMGKLALPKSDHPNTQQAGS